MKVLQVCQKHPPDLSGGSTLYALSLGKKLSGRGLDVEVLCGTTAPEVGAYRLQTSFEKEYPLTRMGLPQERGYGYSHVAKVRELFTPFLITRGIDLVHFHSATGIAEGIGLAAHDLVIPFVITLHDDIQPSCHVEIL